MLDEAKILRDVFISYSSRDQKEVGIVVDVLRTKHNLKVFFSGHDINAGDDFLKDIEKNLRESQVAAIFLSPSALESVYARGEWVRAIDQKAKDQTRKLIPVLLKELEDDQVPIPLNTYQRVDLRNLDFDDRQAVEKSVAQLAMSIEPEIAPAGINAIGIPFVVFAMTREEAEAVATEALKLEEQIEVEVVAPAQNAGAAPPQVLDKDLFRKLASKLDYKIDELTWFYNTSRDEWRPALANPNQDSPMTILSAVEEIVTRINKIRQREMPGAPFIRPQFYSKDFLDNDPEIRIKTWNNLEGLGCVLIIDVVSLLHRVLRKRLEKSGFVQKNSKSISILAPFPMRSFKLPISDVIETDIKDIFERAFNRFDDLDKLCDFGVSNVRGLRRWLFSVLPEAAELIQGLRPSEDSKEKVREQGGPRQGYSGLIYSNKRDRE
jgi:TIR domain-containing protein